MGTPQVGMEVLQQVIQEPCRQVLPWHLVQSKWAANVD